MLLLKLLNLLHLFTSRRGALEFEPEPAGTSGSFLTTIILGPTAGPGWADRADLPCQFGPRPSRRGHVANRAGLLDCRLRVGYFQAGPRRISLREALPNMWSAATLRVTAQRELRARPAQLASTIKRQSPVRPGPPPAKPPWCRMTLRRPCCRRPACTQDLTRCSQGRSVAR